MIIVCTNCKLEIAGATKGRKFCNSSCAATYNNARRFVKSRKFSKKALDNIRESNSNKQKVNKARYFKFPSYCTLCSIKLTYDKRNRKTCSRDCYSELRRQIALSSSLGGKKNSTRFNYQGISMDSSWEVDLAEWLDSRGIKWIRSRSIKFFWKRKNGKLATYYPDFYIPSLNLYLDPKNPYLMKKDAYKISEVERLHNVQVLVGSIEDIQKGLMVLIG